MSLKSDDDHFLRLPELMPLAGILRQGGLRAAAWLALGLGVALVGDAVLAAAVGAVIVMHERGSLSLPWTNRKKTSRPNPLSSREWLQALDGSGQLAEGGRERLIGRIRQGGCEADIRHQVWPFLLGMHGPNSSDTDEEEKRRERRLEFENLKLLAKLVAKKASEEEEQVRLQQQQEEEEKAEEEKRRHEEGERRKAAEAEAEVKVEEVGGKGIEAVDVEGVEGAGGRIKEGADEGNENHRFGLDSTESLASLNASTDSFVDLKDGNGGEEPLDRSMLTEDLVEVLGRSAAASDGGDDGGGSGVRVKAVGVHVADAAVKLEKEDEDAEKDGVGVSSGEEGGDGGEEDVVVAMKGDEQEEESGVDEEEEGKEFKEEEWSKVPAAYREDSKKRADFVSWRRIMRLDAVRMNAAWIPYSTQTDFPEEEAEIAAQAAAIDNYEHLSVPQRLHAARLVTILEAYAVQDPEIGYCQGMSDLLSPFVALLEDDAEAFSCFSVFMQHARHNFRTDEQGIRKQLIFISSVVQAVDSELFRHLELLHGEDCIFVYRMVVVVLRRELSFEQTICLWEVLWAESAAGMALQGVKEAAGDVGGSLVLDSMRHSCSLPTKDLFLFVIVAILVENREKIFKCEGMDEILRMCNELSGNLDIWRIVSRARSIVSIFATKA